MSGVAFFGWLGPCRMLVALATGLTMLTVGSVQAASPTLEELRVRIASDRLAGLAEGWEALEAGWFEEQPEARRSLLWFMGGAALGGADDLALERIVELLSGMGEADPVAASLAGFLRGSRLLRLGQEGEGLVEILQAANALIEIEDSGIQRIASGELCRGYTMAGRLDQALVQCRRQTRLLADLDDPPALAAAEHAEAIVLSYQQQHREAALLWRSARERFRAAGMPELANRLAGSLATALLELGEYAEALDLASEAHRAALASASPTSIAMTGEYVGSALIGLGRYEQAVAVLEQSLQALAGISYPQIERSILLALIEALEAQEDTSEERLAALEDRLEKMVFRQAPSPEQSQTIEQLESMVRQRTLDLRIRELEQEAELRALALETAARESEQREAALRSQRKVSLFAMLAIVALVVASVFLLLLLRSQRQLSASLHDQAYRDALTRLPNRRAFSEAASALLAKRRDDDSVHTLMIVDLDHFKRINDQGGHPLGDDVLVATSQGLLEVAPDSALVARLGGEEFAILCPETDLESALSLAESLRKAIGRLSFELNGKPMQVTASIGLATLAGDSERSLSNWMKRADLALYAAKSGGRNRVERHQDASGHHGQETN